jgi:hypothetical protein
MRLSIPIYSLSANYTISKYALPLNSQYLMDTENIQIENQTSIRDLLQKSFRC